MRVLALSNSALQNLPQLPGHASKAAALTAAGRRPPGWQDAQWLVTNPTMYFYAYEHCDMIPPQCYSWIAWAGPLPQTAVEPAPLRNVPACLAYSLQSVWQQHGKM